MKLFRNKERLKASFYLAVGMLGETLSIYAFVRFVDWLGFLERLDDLWLQRVLFGVIGLMLLARMTEFWVKDLMLKEGLPYFRQAWQDRRNPRRAELRLALWRLKQLQGVEGKKADQARRRLYGHIVELRNHPRIIKKMQQAERARQRDIEQSLKNVHGNTLVELMRISEVIEDDRKRMANDKRFLFDPAAEIEVVQQP